MTSARISRCFVSMPRIRMLPMKHEASGLHPELP
jgi:hypothetical protein